jgi:DNA-directed RNA polymerase specialized sigma24 family protein
VTRPANQVARDPADPTDDNPFAGAIDADTLRRAEAGNRASIERVLRTVYPSVHRVAHALAGDADGAAEVLRFVFANAMRVLPQWSARIDPETWFTHQAVQAVRRVCQGRPPSDRDLLVAALPLDRRPPDPRSPAYAAFVRAVRRLPPQQAEAYVLHHGERLNARLLGVAMDCSTHAAETHLRAADAAVRPIAGDDLPRLTAGLHEACRNLTPAHADADQFVRDYVGRWAGARKRRRVGRLAVALLAVAAVAAAGWHFRDAIGQMLPASGPIEQPASSP